MYESRASWQKIVDEKVVILEACYGHEKTVRQRYLLPYRFFEWFCRLRDHRMNR